MVDYGPIPRFPSIHSQDRQLWYEVGCGEGYSTAGMVSSWTAIVYEVAIPLLDAAADG